MHNFDRVIGIFLTFELDEAEALVFIGDFISGDVNIDNGATLGEKFPQDILVDFGIKISGIDGCLLVSFVEGGDHI